MIEDHTVRYSQVARWLHWTIALLVIFNIVGGIFHDALGKAFPVMPLHKAAGITILFLTLARIVWRLSHPAPPLPSAMPAWEKLAANATHFAFYALLLIVPLTGWIMTSAGDRPLTWFWLFDIPKFGVTKGEAVVDISRGGHGVLGLLFGLLALLHIGAALRHHFVLKDGVLRRMTG
ncbi:MAG: cytochrome b [Sphingobium phenoxybenzoativorans]